ncbi:MAG: hypothetical protein GX297_03870 [Treponema sp.]|nr:hypothetical protein [Treponema sp.]
MKKIFLIFIILFIHLSLFAMTKTDRDFKNFDCFEIFENDYKHNNNWNEITNGKARLFFYFRLSTKENYVFIPEFYYVLVRNNEKYILGGFDIKKGFINGDCVHSFDTSDEDEKFRKNNLIGISIFALRSPFSLQGVALSSDKIIYKTETLQRFTIDSKKMTIVAWTPW